MTGMSQVQLDRYTSSSYTTVSGTASNGGLIRLTVASTAAFTTGDKAYVFSVGGTTEANGFWTVTVINSTTLDLQSSTYANAYTSGGRVQTAGTWTKPSWASAVRLILIGGGGSGGGGSKSASGVTSNGGGGGGGGGVVDLTFAASQFSSTENYSVAASVSGGLGTTANSGATNSGIKGNITAFTISSTTFIAYAGGAAASRLGGGGAGLSGSGGDAGGTFGSAGLNNGTAGATSGSFNSISIQGGGTGGSGHDSAGAGAGAAGSAPFGAAGGGVGGPKTATPTYLNGQSGGASRYVLGGAGGTANGTSTTVQGTEGTAGTGGQPGSGGGGGGSSDGSNSVTKAGNGGNGGIPGGGGGGGGGGLNSVTNGGDGGNGARGEIWVISYEVDPSSTVGFGSFFG